MKILKQNCLNCKHCSKGVHTLYTYYGFECSKKRIRFNYNLKAVIRGAICRFYEQKQESTTT